jgi:hypothetical protein
MADELGRPPDGLDEANQKAAAELAAARKRAGKNPPVNPAVAAQTSGAKSAAESGWKNTIEQQVQSVLNHPAPAVPPPEPPPVPLSEAEQAEYDAALARVRELQNRRYGGSPPPEYAPELRTLRKYRVRLDKVTAKAKVLTDYLRHLKRQPHPLGGQDAVYPDGADVVEAYSEGEAWEKFKARFCIAKTDQNYSVLEAGSPADQKAFELEDRDMMISEAKVPA